MRKELVPKARIVYAVGEGMVGLVVVGEVGECGDGRFGNYFYA